MFFILGPSISTPASAKARVLLQFEGLDVRLWGEREGDESESDEEEEEFGYAEDSFTLYPRSQHLRSVGSDDDGGEEDGCPPLSRSPTLSPSSSSSSRSDSSCSSPGIPETSYSNFEEVEQEQQVDDDDEMESEAELRANERLLSLTLAQAMTDVDILEHWTLLGVQSNIITGFS